VACIRVNVIAIRCSGGLLKWDLWARIDRNRLPRPINTLPLDHKSGSHESLLGLLPDINKPPLVFGLSRDSLCKATKQNYKKRYDADKK
jgi:hypothetical protein